MNSYNFSILTINGSDSSGQSGIQSDIKVISSLGGNALTAITSVTVQNSAGIISIKQMPADIVVGQIKAVYEDVFPKAIKVGLVNDAEAIRLMRGEIIGCRNIVCSLVVLTSDGKRLMSDESVTAMVHHIIPVTKLLVMKCQDAEQILCMPIRTDNDMLQATKRLHDMGAEWVMLRGGRIEEGRVTALLFGKDYHAFFSSYNIEGWQKHGIAGALSTAIATRLCIDDDVPSAINNAHEYLHSQIIYAVNGGKDLRPQELYSKFLSLIAAHYAKEHEVSFYASKLAITTRYLSQITRQTIGKTPKTIIDEYLLSEARKQLLNTTMSVQEISNLLGFSSPIIFSRFIRQKAGITAKEIRITS